MPRASKSKSRSGSRPPTGRRKLRKTSSPQDDDDESSSDEEEHGGSGARRTSVENSASKRGGSTHSNRVDIPDPVSFPTSFNTSSRGTSRSRQAAADAAAVEAAAASDDDNGGGGAADADAVFKVARSSKKSKSGGSSASSKSSKKERPRPVGSRTSSRKPAEKRTPSRPPRPAAVFRTGGTETNSDDESTQVFSTEFISAMHVDESDVLRDYKNITDTWRQKYNDPIQISSGYVGVSLPQRTQMRAKKIAPEYDMEPFARPQAYVRLAPTESSKGGSAGQRDLDMLDMVWLKLYNKKHPDARLDDETMEDMLFEFEQQAFNGAAREKSKIEDEEIELRTDTACDVCGLLEGEPGNEMVFCDGCDTCVHQFCYGVKAIPEGDWYCESCQMDALSLMPSCDLCPIQGGALRKTTRKGKFAHVGCALWIPEVTIPTELEKTPINIDVIPKDRRKLLCCLCKTKSGACIQCQVPTCKTAFHVRCAAQHKLRMDLMLKEDGKDEIIRKAFCPKHWSYKAPEKVVSSLHSDPKATAGSPTTRIYGARTEFCDLVSLPDVEAELDSPMEVIQKVFAYWVQKRRRQDRKPLFRQFVQRKATVRGEGTPGNRVRAGPAMKALMATRLSLERARSLCEMVRRRETKKRDMYKLVRSEFAMAVKTFVAGLDMEVPPTLTSAFWVGEEDSRRERDSARIRRKKQKEAARTPNRPPTMRDIANSMQAKMQSAVDLMRMHPSSGPFWFPVSKAIAPDYYDVVKRPMDLSSMQSKIKNSKYTAMSEFVADFELIAKNCKIYNAKGSPVFREFEMLSDIFYTWKIQHVDGPDASDGGGGSGGGAAAAAGGEVVTGAVSARSLDMSGGN